ncbi:glycosyltransferase family 2 protein [Spirosoma montaniterrae]|uniref:Glycosyl transferase family 2 n=1 Tax=Spirosoma montaniterrae TaxID=1178516 RepID=A0A1P9WZG4_9BACT|nr:glycosyltransferase [Spirosoma montaniterrae]AQG80769.1 glycosyl transferase family 2 [Spirosoma montaniterrae]
MVIFYVLYGFLLFFLLLNVLYICVFAVAGRIGNADDLTTTTVDTHRKIGVLIPAYKEDAVIVDSVLANLRQDYPANRFDLIVIADSLQPDTLAQLGTLPVRVFEVSFPVSTVGKAIRTALDQIQTTDYDIIAVADADNLLAVDFLSRVNEAFAQGWQAIQGHRVAKNTNTSVAVLDAISEEINNSIFRKGSRALGLSSPVIGSGMAFDTALMKQAMTTSVTMGGYDKELEMNIVLNGQSIAYLEKAYVYDEKVAQRAVFENQRTRWIAAQLQFLVHNYKTGCNELLKGRFEVVLGLFRAVIVPRVLLLGVLILLSVAGLFAADNWLWMLPAAMLLTLCVSLLISIPAYLRQKLTVRELLLLPKLMISFGRAILNMQKAFRSFMHTPHTATVGHQPASVPVSARDKTSL